MNNNPILEALDELDNCSELDYEEDDIEITEQDKAFEQEMFIFFNELNAAEGNVIKEEFSSNQKLKKHYEDHCLANDSNKQSKGPTTVYYDFNKVEDYSAHEQNIVNKARSHNAIYVDSLQDSKAVYKAFRKLFEGGQTIVFSRLCSLKDSNGDTITITLNSFATDVTTNYLHNTIDYMITRSSKTRTLFPLDAHYVETKFNNVIKRTFPELHFNINH